MVDGIFATLFTIFAYASPFIELAMIFCSILIDYRFIFIGAFLLPFCIVAWLFRDDFT